jgi:hypothetical protein
MERGSSLFNHDGVRKAAGYTNYEGRGMLFASGQAKITRGLKMPISHQFHWVHADHNRSRFLWAGNLSAPMFTFDNPHHATFDLFSAHATNPCAEMVKIRTVSGGPPAQRPLFNRAILNCSNGQIRRGFVIGGEPFEYTYDANGDVVYTLNASGNKTPIPETSPFWPGHDNTNEGAAFRDATVFNPSFCGVEVNLTQSYEVTVYDMRVQGSGGHWANNLQTRFGVYSHQGNVKIRDGWLMNCRTALWCGGSWSSSSLVMEGTHVEYTSRLLEQPFFPGVTNGQDVILRDVRHAPSEFQPPDGRVVIQRSGGNLTIDQCHFEFTYPGLLDNPFHFDVISQAGKRYRFQDNKLRLGPTQALSTLHSGMQPTHGAGSNQRTDANNVPVGNLF